MDDESNGSSVPMSQRNMTKNTAAPPQQPAKLRDDLIEKAVGFLTHPKVQDSSLDRKKAFLREKKGLSDAEIEEAIRRAGADAVQRPVSSLNGGSMAVSAPAPAPQQQGYSLVTMFAGAVGIAATGLAAYYGYEMYRKTSKKAKKKKAETPKSKTPKSSKSLKKKKDGVEVEVGVMEEVGEVEEIKRNIETALQTQGEEQMKMMTELERLLQQIEENNRQKFELLKSSGPQEDSGMRNDIQTIKQLLLTRNTALTTSAVTAVSPVEEKEKEKEKEEMEENLTESVPLTLSQSSGSQVLKPWEQRRRVRLENAASSPTTTPTTTTTTAAATTVTTPSTPSSTTTPPPSTANTPAVVTPASNVSNPPKKKN